MARTAPFDASSCFYEFSSESMSSNDNGPQQQAAAQSNSDNPGYLAVAAVAGVFVGLAVAYFFAAVRRRRAPIETVALV
jgi:hypothetical protein